MPSNPMQTVPTMRAGRTANAARIRAITFDLDDTLWPIEPVMQRAEQRLNAWLRAHCPRSAAAYPVEAMHALRERIAHDNPRIAHDFTAQRRLTLREALLPHGYGEEHVDGAFAEFYAARNEVQCHADAVPALRALAARYPLAAITNGNADLERIGLARFFRFSLSARDFGMAKPAPEIFREACARLGFAPAQVLHVGDDATHDVLGAQRAGMRSVWLNRAACERPAAVRPDWIVADLHALCAALLGANADHSKESASCNTV